jgi:Ca2+-binding RTX toxin-like protein
MATITATNGNDQYPGELEGTNLADQIFGLAGNDVLVGFNGNDTLEGGAGADQLFGSDGLDLASYRSSPEDVTIMLDQLYAAGGDATGDTLSSIEGAIGSAYGDVLYGGGENGVFRGEGGNDNVSGFGGNDRVEGGSGHDYMSGGTGNDELIGGEGNDTAFFSGANFVIADLASGTAGGSLTVGNDRLTGTENLEGTINNDRLAGDGKANRLDGSYGADELLGRGGADRFVYNFTDDCLPTAVDRILDFSRSQKDKIDLSGVDANVQASGDQAFKFVGQGPFTGVGQIRFFQENGDTVVEANMDTTGAADGVEMRIVLDTAVSLQATDFVL